MIRVGIVGASGYTGAELGRLLANHPDTKITVATSRQYEGKPLSTIFPNLKGQVDIPCVSPGLKELTEKADIFFTAVPHQTAMNIVPEIINAGKKVIDLSADYRLRDITVYEKWYQKHSSPEFISQAVYGLPELYREQIKTSSLIANPGCYPTSIIIGLAPLLKAGVIEPSTIIADSKSGTSGAGRGANTGTLFCEVHDGFKPYKVGRAHRHIPEIEQELSQLAGTSATVSFTPHLLPISRGILSTIYATLTSKISQKAIQEIYNDFYQNEHFIRILPEGEFPATQYVRGSNYCDIAIKVEPKTNRVIVVSAIDNIVKGASGQAVQNMNLMLGLDETTGITNVPLFP